MILSRRAAIAGALAFTGCGGCSAHDQPVVVGPVPPLKSVSGIPVGCCIETDNLRDSAFTGLLLRDFNQITPSYEMKMSICVRPDGSFNFGPADRLIAFAADKGMRLHGSALVWYKYQPAAFQALAGRRDAFERLYADWIGQMVGRTQGVASGWDVINEPIEHEEIRLRDSLWTRVLGPEEHMVMALDLATRADPGAVHFINEYDLERRPEKRLLFMKLIESLLKRGAKIGGIGTQTHIELADRGTIKPAIADLASFGLPLHISELDVSLGRWSVNRAPLGTKLSDQAAVAAEVADAFVALPSSQRYALTLWGLRDRDSWLQMPPFDPARGDLPLAFDDAGKPKPMAAALARSLASAPA
ncbi:1,4-beta-xylanase [Sphingobium amiense]|uniref:Beta-xylanase n=1 Tax=Sphingobium amiense TaxID=135719 RepID=A0A494WFL3_9SPHN|nr:endo-1,4-beta-xylanase [Sphingobium amiense]BBD99722.1 1,4-beta-xylanase [Sphingobium amiense]